MAAKNSSFCMMLKGVREEEDDVWKYESRLASLDTFSKSASRGKAPLFQDLGGGENHERRAWICCKGHVWQDPHF